MKELTLILNDNKNAEMLYEILKKECLKDTVVINEIIEDYYQILACSTNELDVKNLFTMCFKDVFFKFKENYYITKSNKELPTNILNILINHNINYEIEYIANKINYNLPIYLDSILNFLCNEFKKGWEKVSEILIQNKKIFDNDKATEDLIEIFLKKPINVDLS